MQQTFALFSDYFALRSNRLSRFDPRLKALTAVALILSVVFSSRPFWPLLVLAMSLGCMFSIKIPVRVALLRFVPVIIVLAVLMVLRSFLVGGVPLCGFRLLGHAFTVTREGAREGALIAGRVAGAISVVMLSGFITPVPQFYSALLWFRVPEIWVEIASMVYRYIFVIIERARNAILSQRARLGYAGVRRSLHSIGILSGVVFVGAFEQAEGTHRAMIARGYTGRMPTGALPALKKSDLAAMVLVCALIACLYFVFERFIA